MINNLDGDLYVVYRNTGELIITDHDRTTHPAKWNFLKSYTSAKKYKMFRNPGTMESLIANLEL